jgi:hypothetical protein
LKIAIASGIDTAPYQRLVIGFCDHSQLEVSDEQAGSDQPFEAAVELRGYPDHGDGG